MSSLPEEICREILLRAPASSTFICKCVCKSWFQLISDPDFVKTHLDRTTRRNNYSLIFKSNRLYCLSSSYDSDESVFVLLKPPYNHSRYPISSTVVLGSCNGIVYGRNYPMKLFFLWNPATNDYRELPRPRFDVGNSHNSFAGFGYDYKTEGYKLVTIVFESYRNYCVQLYSLRSNSWKSIRSGQYAFRCPQAPGVLLNGALHWFGGIIGDDSKLIISLDVSEERFRSLQLPMTLPTSQYYKSIGLLEECLCVLARGYNAFDVWLMQVYGNPESWINLYTITHESLVCNFRELEIIGSFKNGEILFRDWCNIVSYDSVHGTASETEIDDLNGGCIVKYIESLVPLNSITGVGRKKKKKKRKHLNLEERNRSLHSNVRKKQKFRTQRIG